jgi:hypothetical protein
LEKMARLTTKDLCKNLGLETSGTEYVGATIFLKILCDKGLVTEVDRIVTSRSGKGRRSVVYEIPEVISLRLLCPTAAPAPVQPVVQVPEPQTPVAIAQPQQWTWGDDDEDEEAA